MAARKNNTTTTVAPAVADTFLVRNAKKLDALVPHIKKDAAKPLHQSNTKRAAVAGGLLGLGAIIGSALG